MPFSRVLGGLGGIFLSAVIASAFSGCSDEETTTGTGGAGATSTSGTGGTGGTGGATSGIQIAGQTAPVGAIYDESGLLHLACSTDEDCFAALGYFHAANRFFFMDFVRNLVRGRLGALVKGGNLVLNSDYENRRFFSTIEGEPLEEKLYADASPGVRGYLDAYTRGVNAWIGDMRGGKNGATLTTEYDMPLIVKEAIRDWEPADCAAIGLYVLNDLSNNSSDEISMGVTLPAFDPALAADMFSPRPVFDAFTQPLFPPPPPPSAGTAWTSFLKLRPLLAGAQEGLALVGSGTRSRMPGDTGSNNWVVGPGRTTKGAAILANDPHLPLTNPSIWFPVELDAKSNEGKGAYHMAGSTFPGLPAVMVGRNESIAWGVTTAYWDLADVYVEQVSADGKTVTFNGSQVPIIEKELEFADSSKGNTIKKTFRWVPHHGPIVSEDAAAGTALSIRWRGHDGGTDLDAFFGLGTAGTLAEGRKAVELASSASQNFVIIDKAGDIGWYPYSKVPKRAWASQALPPWLPLPGDGSAEWDSFVPFASLPQLTNPAGGTIATANGDMTGASADGDYLNDGQAAMQAFSKADGTREQRILDLIEDGGNTHSVATMTAIQGDTHSLYGTFVVPIVLAAASGATLKAEEQDLVDALTDWKFTCPTGLEGSDPVAAADSADMVEASESIGCTAFHAVFYSIVDAALADEIAASGVPSDGSDLTFVARALKSPASIASGELLWDDVATMGMVETRDDIMLRAITLAASRLAVTGGPNTWRWGRLHNIALRSIYDSFGVLNYNAPAAAAPGGLFTVNVASPRRTAPDATKPFDFSFRSGASVRFVVEAAADGLHMTYQLPGGVDLHRESPFYNNLLPNWLENKPVDFAFGPGAVTRPAVELEVVPAP